MKIVISILVISIMFLFACWTGFRLGDWEWWVMLVLIGLLGSAEYVSGRRL